MIGHLYDLVLQRSQDAPSLLVDWDGGGGAGSRFYPIF